MESVDKITVLKSIAHEFNKAGIIWALGASMLLYFKGITSSYHDIDIMVMNKDIALVKAIMATLHGKIQPHASSEKYKTETFLEYLLSDVEIDIMGGFAIQNGDQLFDCSLHPDQIVEYLDLDGERIPLQPVGLWCRYYELMGRIEKVRMIKDFDRI